MEVVVASVAAGILIGAIPVTLAWWISSLGRRMDGSDNNPEA